MCVLGSQSCPTLWDPINCSLPGSSVREISQAKILEWVYISFSRKDPGMEPGSPALQADSFPSEPPGKRSKLTGINRKLRCHYMLCVVGVNREIYAMVYSGASNIHMHHSSRVQSKRVCSDGRLQNHCTKQFH